MIDKHNDSHIFCAVDTDDLDRATSLSSAILPYVGGVKLGIQFFSTFGPPGVEVIRQLGLPIFLDLKLFDIPNTVSGINTGFLSYGIAHILLSSFLDIL